MLAVTLAAGAPDAALAHGRATAGPDGWLSISVLAFALICAFCISARSKARDFDVRAIGACLAALAITGVSLSASFHRLSDALFSAHMTQHLTLMMVSAPIVVLGKPNIIVMRALAPSRRRIWARFWRRARKAPFAALFISPLAIWLWFMGLFAFWHLPGPYAFALQHEEAHIAEHLTLLVSACAFWAVAFGELTRLSRGGRLMFVSTAALLSALPGALISIAPRPLYSVHAGATARYGLTPLEDQQIAGLVMWIPAGFIYLAAILGLLFLWLRHAEQGRGARGAALSAAACIVLLSGCNDEKALERAARAAGATGDPQKGAEAITKIGCGSCHLIPGIAGANGLVGPPLDHMGRRVYIAGLLRQTPENLARWVRDPQSIVPGNAMPNMGVSEEQARDIAAYLSTLQ